MADTKHSEHDKDQPVKHRDRYEREDARLSAIVAAGLILFAAAVMTALGMWFFYKYSEKVLVRSDSPVSPIAGDDRQPVPPMPRLQFSPKQDMDAMRAREQQYLTTYGWVGTKSGGTVHIPIERAMEKLLEQGVAVRPDAETAKFVDHGTSFPLESSAGRAWARP